MPPHSSVMNYKGDYRYSIHQRIIRNNPYSFNSFHVIRVVEKLPNYLKISKPTDPSTRVNKQKMSRRTQLLACRGCVRKLTSVFS